MQRDELTERVIALADAVGAGDAPHPTGVPGLSLNRRLAPSALEPMVYDPLFCLVLSGAKACEAAGGRVTFAKGQSLIVSFDLPSRAQVVEASRDAPYVALALKLDLALIRELMPLMGDVPARDPVPEAQPRAVALGEVDADIREAMGRLFTLTQRPEAIPVLAPGIIREIHFWLLRAAHGAMLRRLAEADSHAARIGRAITQLRQSFASTIRVEDLATTAGMSVSGFHAHFRQITGTTPVRFQKHLRLMEARHLISGGQASVTAAAFQVGYASASQFSRDYSGLFGHPPRRDLPGVLPEVAGTGPGPQG